MKQATTICDFCMGEIPATTQSATFVLPYSPEEMAIRARTGQARTVQVFGWFGTVYDGAAERTLDVCLPRAVGILEIARDARARVGR